MTPFCPYLEYKYYFWRNFEIIKNKKIVLMSNVKFYKGGDMPLELHKVRVVQKLPSLLVSEAMSRTEHCGQPELIDTSFDTRRPIYLKYIV